MAKKKAMTRGKRRGDSGDTALYWQQPKPAIHQFTRIIGANNIVQAPTDVGRGISFTLADLPGSTEFTALFDQYRLDWVEYMFVLKSPLGAGGVAAPLIYFVEDHDDDAPPSFNAVLEAQSVQVVNFSADRTMIKFRVRPNIVREVYRGVTPGYERAPPGTWLDCANATVPHYGVKYWVANYNSTSTSSTVIDVILRYHVSFKETV